MNNDVQCLFADICSGVAMRESPVSHRLLNVRATCVSHARTTHAPLTYRPHRWGCEEALRMIFCDRCTERVQCHRQKKKNLHFGACIQRFWSVSCLFPHHLARWHFRSYADRQSSMWHLSQAGEMKQKRNKKSRLIKKPRRKMTTHYRLPNLQNWPTFHQDVKGISPRR